MKIQYKIYKLDTIAVEPEYISNWPYGNISVNPTILREIPQKGFDDISVYTSLLDAEKYLEEVLEKDNYETYVILKEYKYE